MGRFESFAQETSRMIGPLDSMKRWFRHEDAVPASELKRGSDRLIEPEPQPILSEPWLEQLDAAGIPRTLQYPTTTLARILDQAADRFGDLPALYFGHDTWTWQSLLADVNRAAGGLAALGVRKGDRVLLTLPNCPEFFMAFFAAQKLGAIVVNAGPLMGIDDLQTVINLTTPKAVVGMDLASAPLTRADESSVVQQWIWVSLQSYQPMFKWLGYQYKLWHGGKRNGHGGKHNSFADMLASAPARPPTVRCDPSQTAVLQPTGGTTGSLKLAELSHRNLLTNAEQASVWMRCQPGQDRILAVLPLFHVYGLTLNLVTATYNALPIVLAVRFHCGETMELLRRHHPTIFPLVPAICDAISDRLESEDEKNDGEPLLQGLRLCISGSAPLPRTVAERFEKLTGAVVVEGYGLTEASPVTHVNLPSNPRAGSIGLPMPDTQVRVVDLEDSSKDLGPNQPGEMLISGPQVMRGYYANPQQTRKVLTTDADGVTWLHTGDIVRYDEDGFFYVLDRKKDMIIRSGLKIYPTRVEHALRLHKRVADVGVVGRADPVHTEVVTAKVVLNPPLDEDDAAERDRLTRELRDLCREHLAPYEVPSEIEFVQALPRSPLGKLLRREMREQSATEKTAEKEAV